MSRLRRKDSRYSSAGCRGVAERERRARPLRKARLENGHPDYRIQKWNNHNGYKDMYLCDNYMQFKTAIEDFEYTKWLDPAGVPCYVCDK